MSDHGRIIPLTAPPREAERHIEVYAEYAVDLEEPTVANEITKRLAAIEAGVRDNRVEVRRRTRMMLDGVEAERIVVRYYDSAVKKWCIENCIEVVRNGVEYSLDLRTYDRLYQYDRVAFEAVVKSFKFTRE